MKIKIMFILGALICTSSAVLASSAPIILTQPKSQIVNENSPIVELSSSPQLLLDFQFNEGHGVTSASSVGSTILHFDNNGNQIAWSDSTPARDVDPSLAGDFSVFIDNSNSGDYANKYGTFDCDTIDFGDPDAANFDASFTLETWIKGLSKSSDFKQVFFQTQGNSTGRCPRLSFAIYKDFTVYLTTLGVRDIYTGAKIPDDGGWHHIACTFDQMNQQLLTYVDGELASDNPRDDSADGSPLSDWRVSFEAYYRESTIGAEYSGSYPFTGHIDRMRLWKGVLSKEQLDYYTDYKPVVTQPNIITQPKSQTVNEGSSVTFSVVAGGTAPLSYQWYKGSSKISGATKSSYTISSVKSSDAGSYAVTVSNSFGNVTSSAATLTVNVPVTLSSITINGSNSVNVGSTTTYTCTATYSNGTTKTVTPTWSISSGANYASITTTGGVLTGKAAGTATVQAKFTDGGVTKTATKNVSVNAVVVKPTITTQPKSQTVNEGSSVTFSVTATGTGLSYQWYKGSSKISGATKASYTISSATSSDAGSYYVVVSNTAGDTTSSTATLTVNAAVVKPTITTQPKNQTVYEGSSVTFSVTVTGTGLSYQWYKGSSKINGATKASYTISSTTSSDAGSYYVVVSNTAGNATSSTATLTVNTKPYGATINMVSYNAVTYGASCGSLAGTKVGNEIWGVLLYNGQIVAIEAFAGNSSGTPTGKLKGNVIGTDVVPVGTDVIFQLAAYDQGYIDHPNTGNYYYGISAPFTYHTGDSNNPMVLPDMYLIFNSFTIEWVTKPTITTQPKSQMVTEGNSVTFSVVATGTAPLSYQWYKDSSKISGATKASYTISSAKTSDAGSYYVVVSNTAGNATSSTATLTVNAAVVKPTITTQPKSQTVNEGSSVTFSVTATGTDVSYQWYKGSSKISGATKASYTISSAKSNDAGSYYVVVSNTAGNATSSTATLTVNKSNPGGTAVRSIVVDGLTATVTLKLTPNKDVNVYFVEETVPAIGTIIPDDDGVYTPAKNVIRWSFLDSIAREVSYTVTVSSDFSEKVAVSGEVAFDTTIVTITGDNELDFTIKTHPADTNDDFEISMLEVSSYAVAWKLGQNWSREPADIPMDYVMRAALIWRNGGDYIYDPGKAKPACWVSTTVKAASEEETSVSTTERTVRMADGKADVSIELIPAEGISVYLVEEQLSADVTLNVTNISDGGNYIPEKNVIRWSFLDGKARTLTYTLEPEEGFVGIVTLGGKVMFEEETFTIEGDTEAFFRPIIHFVMEDDGKTLILNFTGTLYESEDTVNWTEVEGAQSPFIVNTTKGKKFYRCAQ